MNRFEHLFRRAVFNAEGTSGGGDPPAPVQDTKPAAPESVLFPADNKPVEDRTPPADAGTVDWKEYEADPAKSAEENARLKTEHDAKKPKDEKKDDPADTVPEDGKYALTMPEGVELDQAMLDAVSPRFKELGLTTKQAQALTDDFVKHQQSVAARQSEAWAGTIAKWADDAKADKDIGGTKWDETRSDAIRAVNALGTPALREYLEVSGGGNHPELIRIFAKVGKLVKEDSPPTGGAEGAGKPAEAAHMLFPNDAPKG